MEDKENCDVSDIQSISDQLNRSNANWKDALEKLDRAESDNAGLCAEKNRLMAANEQMRKEFNELKERVAKFEDYGEKVEQFMESLQSFIDATAIVVKVPHDLRKSDPKSTTATTSSAVTVASASMPPPLEPAQAQAPAATTALLPSNKRASPVNIELTQTQTLHLQPNADVQLVDLDNSNDAGSSGLLARDQENGNSSSLFPSPMTTSAPSNQAVSNGTDSALVDNSNKSNSNASQVMPAAQTEPTSHYDDNDNDATLVEQSPSARDNTSHSKTSTPKSNSHAPATRPQNKKRYANRDVIDVNIDTDAERSTRSKTRAAHRSDSNVPVVGPSTSSKVRVKTVRFNIPEDPVSIAPHKVRQRRKTMAF